MKVTIAGKGGVGKTTLAALLVRRLAERGLRTLAVDCDPNPNLAESFELDSSTLGRFRGDDLQRAGESLSLAREPELVEVGPDLWLLGGPPSETPLADAVARGIAGVLLADRFDFTVTDLGAGPELAGVAVGGALNPADLCVALSNGTRVGDLTADRVASACRERRVRTLRLTSPVWRAEETAARLVDRLIAAP